MNLRGSIPAVCIGLFLTSSAQAGLTDWSDLKGCYSTVTFNGQPGSERIEDGGRANLARDFGYATMPGIERIRSFEFTLFKYRQGALRIWDIAAIFPDYGESSFSSDKKTRTWRFNGPMICKSPICDSPTPFTMQTRVTVKDLGNDLLEVHNWRKIPELPDQSMDADDVYVVKREHNNCMICESSDDGSYSCNPYP